MDTCDTIRRHPSRQTLGRLPLFRRGLQEPTKADRLPLPGHHYHQYNQISRHHHNYHYYHHQVEEPIKVDTLQLPGSSILKTSCLIIITIVLLLLSVVLHCLGAGLG